MSESIIVYRSVIGTQGELDSGDVIADIQRSTDNLLEITIDLPDTPRRGVNTSFVISADKLLAAIAREIAKGKV